MYPVQIWVTALVLWLSVVNADPFESSLILLTMEVLTCLDIMAGTHVFFNGLILYFWQKTLVSLAYLF